MLRIPREAGAPGSRRSPGRKARTLSLVLVAVLAASGLYARSRYPGTSAGLWNQLRYGAWEQNHNLWSWVSYLLEFLQKLSFDPDAGVYNFRLTPEEGLDSFERGQLAFHRGEFARAAELLEDHMRREGESEEVLFWLALATLRRAEAENCLTGLRRGEHLGDHQTASFCTLPLQRLHERPDLSRRASRIDEVRVTWLGSGCRGSYPARLRSLAVLDEAGCLSDSRAAP